MMGESKRRQLALTLMCLLAIGCLCVKAGGVGGEAAALLAFAASFPPNSAAGTAFSRLWNPTSSPCSWPGITCSPTSLRVISLSLYPSIFLMPPRIKAAPAAAALSAPAPPDFAPRLADGTNNPKVASAVRILSALSQLPSLQSLSLRSLNLSGPLVPPSLPTFPLLALLDLSSNNLSGSIPIFLCSHFPSLAQLHLESNQLSGSIPPEIAKCTNLASLTLHDNQLSGPIPTSLGQLALLEVFRAGGNVLLSGPVPAELSNCTHLMELGIAATSVSGHIPPELGSLSNLVTVMIFDANLSGPIPSELGKCTQLVELHLFANHLTGLIPGELGKLVNLEKLYLWQNGLSGPIPNELGGLASIQVLDLSQNELSGRIPASFGMLATLWKLYLSANRLSGNIPAELGNCSMLMELQLDRNLLTGHIPEEMGRLLKLEELFLWNNSLEGEIPSSLGKCKRLQFLDLSWNRLSGTLPVDLFELPSLYKFLLMANELSGVIPAAIVHSRALYRLRLGRNKLTGPIPEELGELHNLTFLDISNNQISGSIPASIAKCNALQLFEAHNNLLNDSIPTQLSSLSNLESLDLSFNHLSGSLPPALGSLAQLTKLDVNSNSLSGLIPPELGRCKKLTSLDLSSNSFFGPIPSSLGQISTLSVSLNLSCNTLSGAIPGEFVQLFSLGDLDISHNKLSGTLDVLSKMGSLVSLNISYNLFMGTLPDTYIFSSLSVNNYIGNPGLCRASCNMAARRGSQERGRAIVGFLFGSVGLMFIVGLILLCTLMKHSTARVHEPDNMEWPWELTPFQKLSFTVEDVLERMVESNVIGKGGSGVVYKVEAPSGETIAVKRMKALVVSNARKGDQNGRDYFTTEVEALRAVRHNNIVRLLGVSTNHQVNLLMYDYMPNGSLGEFLHEKRRALDWESRYKIALGAAQGLAYLHHDCMPPILHRDIKANNILLGARLDPYLADFGLAKFVLNSSYPQTVVAGSYGYIAPEYGYTLSITDKSDVYSYGVVLLEVLTGRRPVEAEAQQQAASGGGEGGTAGAVRHLIDWVHEMCHCHHDVTEILDPRLRGMPDPFIKEMLHALGIAMECVHPLPAERPSMRHVVSLLVGIRHDIEEYAKVDVLGGATCKPATHVTKEMITSPKLGYCTNTSSMCSFTPPSCTSG
ncbi:hypothetical protein L7F22_054143 [Adiantum nelumboides]|nr:hypothetical protein [Adiantum nelumboides]